MPGIRSSSSRRRSMSDDEDEVSDVSQSSSTTSKRRRLNNGNASALPSSVPSRSSESKPQFQPGSIVRVKLKNFVTYTSAEFNLGPSLNMILGPNGTGKSTLVCALCLGLGWKPENLGRAKNPGEFIKHGQKEAEIEIELAAGKRHKQNLVIKRIIRSEKDSDKSEKDKSSSKYLINGRTSTKAEVEALCREFNIQIDNLCQFLPQDRVADFANITPIDLLDETQRAAAPPEMTTQHQELKELHKELKKENDNQQGDQETLENLQNRQASSKAEVDRLQERRVTEAKIKALESYIPLAQYDVKRKQAKDLRAEAKAAESEFKMLERELEPQLESTRAKEVYRTQIEQVVKQRTEVIQRADKRAKSLFDSQTQSQRQMEDLDKDYNVKRKAIKEKKGKVSEIEIQIDNLRQKIQSPPEDFDIAGCNNQMRDIKRQVNELSTQGLSIQDKLVENQQKAKRAKFEQDRSQKELDNLSTQEGQQVNKLKAKSIDSAKAWEWLQANKNRFKGPVYGPPIVECSVKDPKFADVVESSISDHATRGFTCTNDEDFRLLQDELLGRNGLNLSDVTISSIRRSLADWKPPVTPQQLQGYGLTGWVLDYLSGPDEVLSMLCEQAQIHRSAVTLARITAAQHKQLENSPIQRWCDASDRYVVSKRYNRAVTTATSIAPAKIWTDTPVDIAQSTTLRRAIAERTEERRELQKEQDGLKVQLATLKKSVSEFNAEIKTLEEHKSEYQRLKAQFELIPQKIANLEVRKTDASSAVTATMSELDAISHEQDECAKERTKQAIEFAKSLDQARKQRDGLVEAQILLIEAKSEVDAFNRANQHVQDQLTKASKTLRENKEQAAAVMAEARALRAKCEEIVQNRSDDDEAVHLEYSEKENVTPETIRNEIEALHGTLDMLNIGNPNALREFEKRQQDIQKIEGRLAEKQGRMQTIEGKIDSIRADWEPRLDEIVSRINDAFSHNFKQIDCAGQVSVDKDDDFSRWAIKIEVKFRSDGEFSVLDAKTQSGGERAVSTIFYLLSLQSLARSPFRVVDEINQGMDPRNERMVHERMVDIACNEHTSQYFLVTPKLLSGLKFHQRMKVHCIASGEYMPVDSHRLNNFEELARLALRVKAAA